MAIQSEYLAYIRAGYARERANLDTVLGAWRSQFDPQNALFGYTPPVWATAVAAVAAFLSQQESDPSLAAQARDILLAHREWTAIMPAEIAAARPEYAEGVPPLEPVFQPLVFIPACERIRDALSADEYQALAGMVADTFRMVFRFPEWGGHNRAMLRAAGLALAARAFPDHPDAPAWASLADELAEESWGRWSIEDAALYQPHWLRALFLYAEARGRDNIADLIQPRMHLRAALQLLTPMRTLPDFGDSHWTPSQWEWLQCFEWGAHHYADPTLKWAAARLWARQQAAEPASVSSATALLDAYRWCDDGIPEREPDLSVDALDDLVMKKIVFRSGWEETATYACLNYRDEGDYGRVARDYLRTTLAVSAEKMHHGHSDENSFTLLMSKGNVLLHESGYREQPPDGIYRADIYQNRLVWREEIKPATLGLLDFLRDNGRYHSVRTERLFWTRLGDAEISRTRVTDEAHGIQCDRTVFCLTNLDCFVVIDSAQALRDGPFTLSALWWATDILSRGATWADTQTAHVQTWQNRRDQALLIAFPSAPPSHVHVETFRRSFQEETLVASSWHGHLRARDTVSLTTLLWAHPAGTGAGASAEVLAAAAQIIPCAPGERGTAISIDWAGEQRTLGVLHDLTSGWISPDVRPRYTAAQGQTAYGSLVTDAALVYSRAYTNRAYTGREGERRLWAGFIDGTSLSAHGRALYAGQPHGMFQEDRSAANGVPARFRWEGEVTG